MKTIMMALMAMVLAGCAGRAPIQATPQQRSRAVTVLICGGTVHDVATELAVTDTEARRVVRATIKDLMHGLQRRYE